MSLSVASGLIAPVRPARTEAAVVHPSKPRADDNVRAISAALALCVFLWGLKATLIWWYFIVKDINPLREAPLDGALVVGGADLFLCAFLAGVYRVMLAISHRLPHPLDFLVGPVGIFLIHILIVIFSVASFEVTRIYGWPLDIQHLRSADDPRIIASSVSAYSGIVPCGLILTGVATWLILGRMLESVFSRMRKKHSPLQLWGGLACVAGLMFGAWGVRLRQIDTFGVKQNAVAYFVVHYKSAPGPIEVRQIMQDLGRQPGVQDPQSGTLASLHSPSPTLRRDFVCAANARGMNLLVIQLESTSASYLDEKTTPNLMRLAARGVSFANHATVFTETTRATYGIYYSDYMTDLGTTPRMLYGNRLPQPSLMEVMRAAGYDTALFHSGFLSYADEAYLFQDKGVDKIVDANGLWTGGELPWSWGVREEQTVAAIDQWITQRQGNKPFFAIYSSEFPHHPYTCPIEEKPYPETSWLNRYRNSLHYADKCVGILLDRLEAQKKLDNTIIVVVGDHGETVSTYPVGHGLALTREEVFTPFIISNPRLFPSAQVSKLSTNHIDIAPTVARLFGLSAPSEWLGRNLLAERVPARIMFIQAKLAQIHGVIDNGVIYVNETARGRRQMLDTSNGGSRTLAAGPESASLLPRYQAADELFQKWAVWRHLARANQELQASQVRGMQSRAVPAAN